MITISPRELIRPGEVSRIYYGYRRYACGHPVPKGGIFMKQPKGAGNDDAAIEPVEHDDSAIFGHSVENDMVAQFP